MSPRPSFETMTDGDRPTPPESLDSELRVMLEALAAMNAETIRVVADHAVELAAWAETRAESTATEARDGAPRAVDRDRTRPAGVPDDADVSRIEIDGVAYAYYQWREGDRIRSKSVRQ
jgi:Ni/Co efflux regulator RcnB